jgi:MFS family permease
MVWLIWAQELWALYLFAIVFGVGDGGFYSPSTAMVGDIFGLRNIGVIMGVLAAAWGIGAAVGPAMGGLIFDTNRSYFFAFLAGALAVMLATVLVAFLRSELKSNG